MKPNTTLISAASSAAPKVSRYDASTRGPVAAAQNASHPWPVDLTNTADNGMRTSSDRYVSARPNVGPKPGSTRRGRWRDLLASGPLRTAVFTSTLPERVTRPDRVPTNACEGTTSSEFAYPENASQERCLRECAVSAPPLPSPALHGRGFEFPSPTCGRRPGWGRKEQSLAAFNQTRAALTPAARLRTVNPTRHGRQSAEQLDDVRTDRHRRMPVLPRGLRRDVRRCADRSRGQPDRPLRCAGGA